MAFLVSGLFDRVGGPPYSDNAAADQGEVEDWEKAACRLLSTLFQDNGQELNDTHAPEGVASAPDVGVKSPSTSKKPFNWAAYRAVFKDTPYYAAVTALFAEYALLVGRITRHLGEASATPVTLSEGRAIAQQARDFVLGYVNPILGPMRTTKLHRLLCHLLHAVQYHGNILNANTSSNEGEHKQDKSHYARTNKRPGFTRQLVRHAHGTRSVLRRNAVALTSRESAAAEDCEVSGNGGYAADNDAAAPVLRRARVAHLPHERVRVLASNPGLEHVGSVIGASDQDRVAVPGHVFFMARLPHGPPVRQMVHASPAYHGNAWFDHVEYLASAPSERTTTQYGQVRLLVRRKDGVDAAVVAEMDRVVGADECPLSARGCTQLRWAVSHVGDEEEDCRRVKLRLVRVSDILCVVHVVPDCAEMGRRLGIGVTPPLFGESSERMWSMRYLVNVFLPDKEH